MRVFHVSKPSGMEISLLTSMISEDECKKIIELSLKDMITGTVSDNETGENRLDESRVCQMSWPDVNSNPVFDKISSRVSMVTGVNPLFFERIQVIRYLPGGEYKAHFDSFPEHHKTIQDGGNRQLTCILYLNTLNNGDGGETYFPEIGLDVTPIAGCAVLFKNLDAQWKRLPDSLHGGRPLLKGEKWIATTWIRERFFSGNGKTA